MSLRRADAATAACLGFLCLAVLGEHFANWPWAGQGAAAALVAFAIAGQGRFRLRERALLVLAVAASLAAVWLTSAPGALALDALRRAAYLAAFMVSLSLLRDAAVTSPAVLALGRFLTRQPPGRRYLAQQSGGFAIGVVLNFGVLSLIGPLIQRGVQASADGELVTRIRERRQMAALMRGFSWMVAWSPTSIVQALVPAVVLGADPLRIATLGFAIALVMLSLGWAEDRIRFRGLRSRLAARNLLPPVSVEPFPLAAFGRFAGICLALALLALAAVALSGVRLVTALMLVAPPVTALWVWAQSRGAAHTVRRYRDIALVSVPQGSPEALTLAVAGYTGMVTAGLLGGRELAPIDYLAALPPPALYVLIPALVVAASNLALPPMLTVTFLGSLLIDNPLLRADPTLLGLAFVLGWALNLTASPFSAAALVLSRATGIAGATLSWRWNGVFSLCAYAVAALALVSLPA